MAPGEVGSGCSLQVPPVLLHVDASLSSWGTHLRDLTALGVWAQEENLLHINILEMRLVVLVLATFSQLSHEQQCHYCGVLEESDALSHE